MALAFAVSAAAAGSGNGGTPTTEPSRPAAVADAAQAPPDRKYLLERVDDAAVVQLYADGFEPLPLEQKTADLAPLPGGARRARHLLRPALRAQPGDARRARGDHHAPGRASTPATLAEIQRYTKLFWINTGPYNNLTARKFVLKCTPEAFAAAAHAAHEGGREVPARGRARRSTRCSKRLQPLFFDATVDPIVTNKTPGPGQGHPAGERQQPLRRRHDEGPRGVQGALPAQLAAREAGRQARRGGLPRRRHGTTRQIREIVEHLEAAIPYATEPMAKALRALVKFYQTGEDRRPRGLRHRLGPGQGLAGRHDQRLHRGLHGRARHQGVVGGAGLLRQPGEDRGDPQARRRRAVVRGPHAVGRRSTGSRASAASPPTPSTSSSRPATRRRSRRSASTCRTTRTSASSTAASRCRCRTSTRPTTSRRRRSSAASSPGRPRKPQRAEKWSSLAGELTTEHARGDRPRLRARSPSSCKGSPQTALKEQYSALEESRADLVALYFMPDPKLVELGLVDAKDQDEIVRAEYEGYTRNALVQLRRVREGTQIEEDHMRNRQMIVRWLMANSKAIDVRERDGKTYYVMVDAEGVPAKASAGCSPRCSGSRPKGTTRRRRSCSRPTACTSTPGCATRSSRASSSSTCRPTPGFVQPRLEAVNGRGRQDHRRQDLVSAGPDGADAGVLGASRK